MTPAEIVIKKFGGVRRLARIIGRSPSAVCQWKGKRAYGLKGSIPSALTKKILAEARKREIRITVSEIIFGKIGG